MTPYNEQEVLAFADDALAIYGLAGVALDAGSGVWIARMQFDAVTMGYAAARAAQLAGLKQALGVTQGEKPEHLPTGPINGSWQDWFRGLVANAPFSWSADGADVAQGFLLSLEPVLNAAHVRLTPPNALGQRTKIGIPQEDGSTQWVRVGFGEGQWVWVVQPGEQ